MGKRRTGFLTQWQWDYIRTNPEELSKTRQRIEDYYIMKSIEKTLEQLKDAKQWLDFKEIQSLYIDENEVRAIEEIFDSVSGKRKGKMHRFRRGLQCPHCAQSFIVRISTFKGKIVDVCYSYGLPRKALTNIERNGGEKNES